MKRLRMAVVGVGALGRHHARILSEMPGVELVAVADPSPNGERVAHSCRCQCVDDYRELLTSEFAIDAVSIAVPTTYHLDVALPFLKARIPVLVEKPLAVDVDQARELCRVAAEMNVPLQVGHVERFNPATVAAKNGCGTPKYISAERLSPYSFRSTDIGVVHDLMIHDIDLVLDLVDSPVRDVQAFGMCVMGGNEDVVKARLMFESGCIADLTASRVNLSGSRSMQIWSPQGTTTVDFTSREVTRYAPSETLLFGTSPLERSQQPGANIEQLKSSVFGKFVTVDSVPVQEGDALTAELASFANSVRTGSRPVCSGEDALKAMEVADLVQRGVQAHQWDGTPDGAVGPHATFQTPHRKAG